MLIILASKVLELEKLEQCKETKVNWIRIFVGKETTWFWVSDEILQAMSHVIVGVKPWMSSEVKNI